MKYLQKILLILIIPFFFYINLVAQSIDSTLSNQLDAKRIPVSLMSKNIPQKHNLFDTKKDYYTLGAIALGYSSVIYQINNYYRNTWWKSDSNYIYNGSFNVVSDNKYARNIDKFGHAFGAAVISHFLSAGFEAANFDEESAVWYGAIGGLAMQLYVEIQDGFAPIEKVSGKPKWGFSPGDALSDLFGAGYFVGRYYYPYLNNFQLRVSYWPSKELRNGNKPDNNFSDDYEGQKMWLALRMKNLLPKSIAEYWPSFLMLSVGYFVSGIGDFSNANNTKPFYYLAFDFDAEVIPLHGKFWSFIKNTLNYIHFPMPGLEISEDGIKLALFIY